MHRVILKYLILIVLFVLSGRMEAISGTPTYDLAPEEGFYGFTMFNPYYEAVGERLDLLSPYVKCQTVFLSSFSEESAVYLKYDNDKKNAPPIVVSTKFKRQLWVEMHKLIEARAGKKRSYSVGAEAQRKVLPKIKSEVIRMEASIDPEIAAVIERVWNAMLKRVHYPENSGGGLDGENYHFANFEKYVGIRTGKVWSPNEGTLSYDLVELAKALRAYPAQPEIDRSGAAQTILKKAQDLLTRIENEKDICK